MSSQSANRLRRPVVATLIAIVSALTAIGVVIASASASSRLAHRHHGRLSVFDRPDRARVAGATAAEAAPGAILAAVFGKTSVYVRQENGTDCLDHFTTGAAGGGGCAPASRVAERGSVGVFQEGPGATSANSPATLRVTALIPDGVRTVAFTDRDGRSYAVAVEDNVVVDEDTDLASATYVLPDGETETTDVASIVSRTPLQPGAPGSTR